MDRDDSPAQEDGHGRHRRAATAASLCLLGVGLVLVVTTTMFAPPETLEVAHEAAPDWVGLRAVEMTLNVALFVPLGMAVGLIARARWLWALVALSVTIEVVQLWLPERQTELIDVATNSAGAVLGYLMARSLRRRYFLPGQVVHRDTRT